MPEIGKIHRTPNDVGVSIEWRIRCFFSLSKKDGKCYSSSDFAFGCHTWHLQIYPNGWDGSHSSGHIALALVRTSSGPPTKQEFSLCLKSLKGGKYHERHFTKHFEEWNCHYFRNFLPRSELTRRCSELVPHGVLTVLCIMKQTVSDKRASNTDSASAECWHCKGTFDAESLSSHYKMCMYRPIKCPDCLVIVVLQKWLDEHECEKERPEGKSLEKNSGNTFVEACTQTEEENGKGHKENSENKSVDASTQTEEEDGLKNMNEDFQETFLNGNIGDVVLKICDRESREHKCVLAARSPAFLALIMHGTKIKIRSVVDIHDVELIIFSDFINYLYTERVENLTLEKTLKLYTVANKYQANELKKTCLDYMLANISVDNFCDVFTLSFRYEENDLNEACVQFFAENSLDIIFTSRWQTFLTENPIIGNELFIKHIQRTKSR